MGNKKRWKGRNSFAAGVLILGLIGGMAPGVSARPINEGTAMDGEHQEMIFIRWDRHSESQIQGDKYHQYPEWLVEAYLSDQENNEDYGDDEEDWKDEVLAIETEETIAEGMLQFMKLSEPLGLSSRELEIILKDTGFEGLGRAFMESGRAREINELFLVTEAMREAKDNNPENTEGIWVETVAGSPVEPRFVYNLFGIGALKNNHRKSASEYAYEQEWFTLEESIKGGAEWLGDHKIHSGEEAQDTFFKELAEAFNEPENLETRLIELEKIHQWQRETIKDFYESLHLFTYYFEIPKEAFEELPGEEPESQWPVPEREHVSSGFGFRRDPFEDDLRFHYGMDIPGSLEEPVVAARSGVVIVSRKGGSYGNWIEIDHGQGWTTRYAHNHENLVTAGEEIEKGQVIALLGSTGRSTGPHLHFEVRKNGKPIDPMSWFREETVE